MEKRKFISLNFLPSRLKRSLMKFQRDGIRYGIEKEGRCLIGDEMGLGKTLQAIGIAYYFKASWPLLIIVPSSMKFSWVNELEEWLPDIEPGDVNVIRSLSCIGSMMNSRINIISYGLLSFQRTQTNSLADLIQKANMGVAIIDESHYMKGFKAIRTKEILKSVKKIPHVILLSGTPSLSRPVELYPQISLIRPGLFGSFQEFGSRYCAGHYTTERGRDGKFYQKFDTRGASHLDELHRKLVENIMVRRLKKNVLTQLPAKRRQKIMFEIPHSSCYKKELDSCQKELKNVLQKLSNEQLDDDKLVTSMDYRSTFSKLFTATSLAKAGPVQQYIIDLLDGMENKFIVFCYHLTMVQAVRQTLISKKVKHISITGEVNSMQRGIDADIFQTDPLCRVAVLSIQAAGTGLTLTAADHVIFAELHYTPGVLMQAEDRCHRIGQTNAVQIHYLIAMDSIDEILWTCLQRKIIVTTATLNGKISNLPVDSEDKNSLLSAVEAWVPVAIEKDVVDNLFEKKPEHEDIRTFFTPGGKKRLKKRKKIQSIVLMDDDDHDNDFQPVRKKTKQIVTTVEPNKPYDKATSTLDVDSSVADYTNVSIAGSTMSCCDESIKNLALPKFNKIEEQKYENRAKKEDICFSDIGTLSKKKKKELSLDCQAGSNSDTPVCIDSDDEENDGRCEGCEGNTPVMFSENSNSCDTNVDLLPYKDPPRNCFTQCTPSEGIDYVIPSPPMKDVLSDDDLFAVNDEEIRDMADPEISSENSLHGNVQVEDKNGLMIQDNAIEWNCSQCTYLNHQLLTVCEMCGNGKIEKLNDSVKVCSSNRNVDIESFSSSDGDDEKLTPSANLSKQDSVLNSSIQSFNSEILVEDDDDEEFEGALCLLNENELTDEPKSSQDDKSIPEEKSTPGCNFFCKDDFDFSDDAINQDILSLQENKLGEGGNEEEECDMYEEEEEEEELIPEDIRKINLRYCMSVYTKRVFVYDETGKYLQMNFNVESINLKLFEDLPPLLQHVENLKQIKRFASLWKELGPRKQSLVQKVRKVFCSPVEMYKEAYEDAYGRKKKTYDRYISKDEEDAHVKNAADSAGGKVIKLKPPSTKRTGKQEKPIIKNGDKDANMLQAVDKEGFALCLYCSSRVPGIQSGAREGKYCSQRCMEEHKIRRKARDYGPRELLYEVEQGICQICAIDAHALFEQVTSANPETRKSVLESTPFVKLPINILNRMVKNPKPGLFWEADHITPVVEGGGQCGLENYRTLCVPCHRDVTKKLRKKMASHKKGKACASVTDFFSSKSS